MARQLCKQNSCHWCSLQYAGGNIANRQALANNLITEKANATAAQPDSKKANATKNAQKIDNITGIRSNIAFLKANPDWTMLWAKICSRKPVVPVLIRLLIKQNFPLYKGWCGATWFS
jgi:hypothetical protein